LKAPIELATGQHFGQEGLTDTHGPNQANLLMQMLQNTPAARAISTGSTLEKAIEGEKSPTAAAIDLLTGGKVSEVDPAKERMATERDLIEQLLSRDPNVRKYTDYYVRPQDMATLTPTELSALRLQKTLEARAQAAARAKR
jgi:hypothetical protein